MALVALIVDRRGGDHTLSLSPMGVVAIRAAHLALAHRMMGRLPHVGPDVRVTGETLLHGGGGLELSVL